MQMRILVILAMSACIQMAVADTIELWSGRKAEDVNILGVEDGILKFQHEGRVRTAKLTSIKNISKASSTCKVVDFTDYSMKNTKGKVLTISVVDPRPRIMQPYIRVFCCMQDSRGAFQLYTYQNVRRTDPTRVYGLPLVEADLYSKRHYFLNLRGIAYRIEIWQDGHLMSMREELAEDAELPAGWYRILKVKSSRTIKPVDVEIATTIEEARVEELQKAPASCHISTVGLKPVHLKKTVAVNVHYSLLSAGAERTIIPTVKFHYVAEDKDSHRHMGTLSLEPKAGRETKLVSGRTSRTATAELPETVQVSLLAASKSGGRKRVVHWVVEVKYGNMVVATKEKYNPTLKRGLPADWWKEKP
jgi:hypothetical protein